MWIGGLCQRLAEPALASIGMTLPPYIGAMLVAAVMRNLDDATGLVGHVAADDRRPRQRRALALPRARADDAAAVGARPASRCRSRSSWSSRSRSSRRSRAGRVFRLDGPRLRGRGHRRAASAGSCSGPRPTRWPTWRRWSSGTARRRAPSSSCRWSAPSSSTSRATRHADLSASCQRAAEPGSDADGAHAITRDAAWALVTEYTQSESLRKHALAVEAAVRGYARTFGEDEDEWGVVALLHDFDYERWPDAREPPVPRRRDPARAGLPGVGDARDPLARRLHRRAARDRGSSTRCSPATRWPGFVTAAALVRPTQERARPRGLVGA